MNTPNSVEEIKIDRILRIAFIASFIFCLHGINWGKIEEWNPEQMAFRYFHSLSDVFSSPGNFLKPPFHTYFNFFLSYLPLNLIEKAFSLTPNSLTSGATILIWSRLLTIFLFLSSSILVFQITKRFFGSVAAQIVTLTFLTSAGFITYSHFLTADIPVMFWMLLGFYFIQNIYLQSKVFDYILAGFFTGIATATKYNGLAIGLGIPVAHILLLNDLTWKKLLLSKKLFLGLLMVVVGFLVGNPFALLDYHTFVTDFVYIYNHSHL